MHILLTNDDGIFAPGIKVLAEHLSKIAKLTVIAPDRNQSGVSSAISLETPLRVMQTSNPNWYQMNGTPADCVKLALSGFLNEEPDMVVSGINSSTNLGDDVLYSGTVGGALEGRFLAYPPLAVSSAGDNDAAYDAAARLAVRVVKRLKKQNLPGVVFNMNTPDAKFDDIKGIQVTRQGDRHFSEPLKPTEDGRGKRIYWLGEAGRVKDSGIGTDFHAVHEMYAALTPMHVDLTMHDKINAVQNWLDA